MQEINKSNILKQFMKIPGVGKSIAQDLWLLGFRSIESLKFEDPQKMYDKSCKIYGQHVDRCLLYVYRCAVYYASNDSHDPELLKWWHWKD